MATWQLRPAEHPDLSDSLTHFTGRGRESAMVAQSIRELSPKERLDSILTTGELWPSATYSGGLPAICFTESTFAGRSTSLASRDSNPGVWFWTGSGCSTRAAPRSGIFGREMRPRSEGLALDYRPGPSDSTQIRTGHQIGYTNVNGVSPASPASRRLSSTPPRSGR